MISLQRLIVCVLLSWAPLEVLAQYPVKPIRMIVPFPAGGTADIFARHVAAQLSNSLRTNVIVDNRTGAAGNIGTALVAKAAADGYTLLLGTSGSNAINPTLYANLPYDRLKDIALIATIAVTPNVLVVRSDFPARDLKQLIALGRSKIEGLTYGSSGIGSVLHLSGAVLASRTGMKAVHVAYQGIPPALIDLLGGRIDMMVANAPSVVGDITAGKVRAIAVIGTNRLASLPDVPTMTQAGLADFEFASWFAVMAPAAIPRNIAELLNREVYSIVTNSSTRERFAEMAAEPFAIQGVAKAQAFYVSELEKWGAVVRASGVRAE